MNANSWTLDRALPGDRQAVEALLGLCGLPLDGVADHFEGFVVARDGGRSILGCAGIEVHGPAAVFRSLAVRPEARSGGIGRALMHATLDSARRAGCREVYLLTRTIERMASLMGFERIDRETVSPAGRASSEFGINACATATVMRLTF